MGALLVACGGGSNGNKIAFTSDRYGDWEIFVMNADGSNVVALGQQGVVSSWVG